MTLMKGYKTKIICGHCRSSMRVSDDGLIYECLSTTKRACEKNKIGKDCLVVVTENDGDLIIKNHKIYIQKSLFT